MKIFSNERICIERITVGVINTNCYVLYSDSSCIVVDPGFEAEKIEAFLDGNGIRPEAVYLTHGHFDHMAAADEIRKKYGIKVFISENDLALAAHPDGNCSAMFDEVYSFSADDRFADGDELDFAGETAKVLATPGHTRGSVCFYLEKDKILFAGDTLFYASSGRTDLATGSSGDMQESLERLFRLPEDVKVLPGHGAGTTIGKEKLRGGDFWW